MNASPIQLSTSLFSLALEWNSGAFTLKQLLAKVREISVGNGIEIVGFQTLKGYPHLSPDQVSEVKTLMDQFGFIPACLGANLDHALRRNRLLNKNEALEYLLPQLNTAKQLGFPVLRLSFSTRPSIIRKLIPVAEKAQVKLGVEIHAPLQVHQPAVQELRELFHEINSPYLGFVADFSTSMRKIPEALLYSFREVGVTDELIALTNEIWRKDISINEKHAELQQRARAIGATPPQLGRLAMSFAMNGRQKVEDWKELVPQTIHLHGKFYGVDDNGEEPSIDYPGIIKMFYEGGYSGFLSSEYEGTAFCDEYSGFEQVHRHQQMCYRILKNLEAGKTDKKNSANQIKTA